MAFLTHKKGYLGFFIAGGIVTAGGGSILAMGIMYAWMGGMFQNMMDGLGGTGEMPSFSTIFGTMGIGLAIGGGIALVVGLALLGTGVSKKKEYHAANDTASVPGVSGPGTQSGRERSFSPSPLYGSISAPVPSPAPAAVRCRSCGETLPEGTDAQFCPGCGAPTK